MQCRLCLFIAYTEHVPDPQHSMHSGQRVLRGSCNQEAVDWENVLYFPDSVPFLMLGLKELLRVLHSAAHTHSRP